MGLKYYMYWGVHDMTERHMGKIVLIWKSFFCLLFQRQIITWSALYIQKYYRRYSNHFCIYRSWRGLCYRGASICSTWTLVTGILFLYFVFLYKNRFVPFCFRCFKSLIIIFWFCCIIFRSRMLLQSLPFFKIFRK